MHLKKCVREHDLPYAIEFAYHEAMKSHSCRAFSHRKRGWSHPTFSITKDIKVQIDTNFGYGNSSYFYLTLYFKDIAIAPYSNWVVYSNGSLYEIIRHTSKHRVEHESWFEVMTYIRDAVNLYHDDQQAFVETYILGECELLINGLSSILENKTNLPFYASFHSCTEDKYRIGNTFLLNRYRSEKITGAIDFISGILSCNIFTDTEKYVKKIQEFNFKFKPELDDEIERLELELPLARELLKNAEDKYEESKKNLEPTGNILMRINRIGDYRKRNQLGNNKNALMLFYDKYPYHDDLQNIHNENIKVKTQYTRYKNEIETFINQFTAHREKIEKLISEKC